MNMDILFIENEGLWREHCLLQIHNAKQFAPNVFKKEQLSKPLNEIALKIFREWSFIDLFLINIHLHTSGKNRSVCSGIKLLKYIRLNHIDKHCVLYSFLSKEQLMQVSPENLIIFSPGVTYLQLPWDFSQIDFFKLRALKAPGDLSMFLKAESRLPDNRHFFANWWGARQLWEIQQVITPVNDDLIKQLNDQIFSSSKGFDSYQGLLAQYLYSHNIQKSSDKYVEYQREIHNHFQHFSFQLDTLDDSNKQIDKKIESATKEHNRLSEILQELKANNQWQQFFLWLSGKPKEIQTRIQHFTEYIQKARTEIERNLRFKELNEYIKSEELSKLKEKENLIAEKAKALEEQKTRSFHIKGEQTVKQILQSESPKILYIDDQAAEGWATVFQLMIYGDKKPDRFESIIPDDKSDTISIINDCFSSVERFNPDLIILDLKLLGDKESSLNPLELTGAKVLRSLKTGIRKEYAGSIAPVNCPVMIVTASNKIFTYQAVNSLGADACWIKEGLDNRFSLDDSINNYWDFLYKVFILCRSNEFRFIRKMKEGLVKLKKSENCWWQGKDRFSFKLDDKADIRKILKEDVIDILEKSVVFAETYYQSQLMKSIDLSLENSFPSLMAIKLFQVIETIHNENVEVYSDLKKVIDRHHENESHGKLDNIIKVRNTSAHETNLNINELDDFYDNLIEYLINRPIVKEEIKIVGNLNGKNEITKSTFVNKGPQKYSGKIALINRGKGYFNILPINLPTNLKANWDSSCSEMGIFDDGARKDEYILFELQKDSTGKYHACNVIYTKQTR